MNALVPTLENEHALISQCLNGDLRAFEQIYRTYEQPLLNTGLRMLGNRQDAEDAAQETFVRALRSLDSWDSERPIEPWLMTIAGNCCRTALARRKRKPPGLPLVEQDLHVEELASVASHLSEELNRALEHLRPDHVIAFRLFHEENLSYAEIATALGCALGTAKTWIHRARREVVAELIKREVLEPHHDRLRSSRERTEPVSG